MFPHIVIFNQTYSTSILLIGLTVVLCILIFSLGLRQVAFWRKLFIVLACTATAFVGGRLMHVFWEEPAYFREHPEMIFANWNGMVFYGGFILGAVAFALLTLALIPKTLQRRAWDLSALCVCAGLVILRFSCFAEGCCWGTPTALPWAVQYFNPEAIMPWLGIPVHPVQLYESLGALIIELVLWRFLLLKKHQGQLFLIFLAAYSVLRIITEFFRGDAGRGEDVAFHLSTSQFISAFILLGVIMFTVIKKFRYKATVDGKMAGLVLALLFLSSCFLPQKPDSDVIKKVVMTSPAFEWNLMAREKKVVNTGPHSTGMTSVSIPNTGRDALLVSLDEEVQKFFEKPIMKAYKTDKPIRLEELMWWWYSPVFQKLYDRVLRIPYTQFTSKNLLSAIATMEREKRPYDIILMTHGVPNNLVTITKPDEPLFSYEDLAKLKGKLKYAQVVFMQACFGDTLAPDWHAAGVPAVLSYSEFNRNFFYLPYFLENLKKKKWDVSKAQDKTLAEINDKIKDSFMLSKIIPLIPMDRDTYLKKFPPPAGVDPDEYLNSAPKRFLDVETYLEVSPPPKLTLK